MTYVYQWFGAVNGCAFLYGCMLGMAAQAARYPGYPRLAAQTAGPESPRQQPASVPSRS